MDCSFINSDYVIYENGDMYNVSRGIKLKSYLKDGVPVYSYHDEGKLRTRKVRMLVAESFVSNHLMFNFVTNIDGNVHNNNSDNLRWVHSITKTKIINEHGKECSRCEKFLEYSKFPKRNNRKSGYQSICISCSTNISRNRKKENPDQFRNAHYKLKYNSSLYEFDSMLKLQGGVCAICKTLKKKMCMDHCHLTGKIRGVLCDNCNRGIGLLNDDVSILKNALNYLTK